MKRFIIFSDTHGDTSKCIDVIYRTQPDAVIHAGDCTADAKDLMEIYPEIKFYCVRGNNDFSTVFPDRLLFESEGKRIFITHGHDYRVKYDSDYRTLLAKAKSVNADLCIFGHTHIPYSDYRDNVRIINPGSMRYGKTYAVCEIENGKLKTCILDA